MADRSLRARSPEIKELSERIPGDENAKRFSIGHTSRERRLVMVDATSPLSTSPACDIVSDTTLPRQQAPNIAQDSRQIQHTKNTNRQKPQSGLDQKGIIVAGLDTASQHPPPASPSRLGSLWATHAVVTSPLTSSSPWASTAEQFPQYESTGSLSTIRANYNARRAATEHVRGLSWADPSDTDTAWETSSLNWSTIRSRVRAGIAAQAGGCEVLRGHTPTPENID